MRDDLSRRGFLARSGAASAALLAPWTRVEGARGYRSNDTINVACIGTGGRCRHLMQRLASIPNVRMVAVCDVWDLAREEGRKLAAPEASAEIEYRRLLDREDIDAVLVGSPDHWHVPMTVDACDAGKDVYVEKPLTHDPSEGDRVIEAQDRNARVVQVGTQQRSMPHLVEARELVRAGVLGPIHKVRMTWNRNVRRWDSRAPEIDPNTVRWDLFLGGAPAQPFDPYRFRNWRWFWDFGGGIFTDLMVHWIDTARWMMADLGDPDRALSVGDRVATRDFWETPDTVQTLVHYPEGPVQAHFAGTFINHNERAMLELQGRDATLYCDRGRFELVPQAEAGVEARSRIESPAPRGSDFFEEVDGELYHLRDWVEAMRARRKPSCPAEEGVRSANVAHLANRALRGGGLARWDELTGAEG